MSKDYVEQRDDGYWIAGKRISLASVVYEFQRGAAPESILRSFPLLTLEEAYGAITFYLSNREGIDALVGKAGFPRMSLHLSTYVIYDLLCNSTITSPRLVLLRT